MSDESNVETLTAIFARLGADDPASWAESQIDEDIPQLGLFVFLKQAWENIIDESEPDKWFDEVEQLGAENPNYFWGQLSAAVSNLQDAGVTRAQLTPLIQLLQYDMLNYLCYQLDDGGLASTVNVHPDEDGAPIRWRLDQVDEEGNVIGTLDGLHEYSDGEPPHGRDSGFRSPPR